MSPGASRNLILTGFMGTGKTVVGQLVAQQLGRPFLDMDIEIEARIGKSIAQIFDEDGEAAFRAMEAAVCREIRQLEGHIVATGGGALVDAVNRTLLMENGTVICLSAKVDELLDRLAESGDRPLLQVADPRGAAEQLLHTRNEAYSAIPWQIDTNGLPLEEVARRVMTFADVRSLPVRHTEGHYPVHIGGGLLGYVGGALRAAGAGQGTRVAVVTNPVVAPLYFGRVEEGLQAAGFTPRLCMIPDGEQHKTLATVADLYEQFLTAGLDRHDTVLSLGGGVTGDIAGFAAATYLRGIRLGQVPTTLLAMVDASVGGKTGVDLPEGKNLVGAFKQPAVVLIDPDVLRTLAAEEVRAGIAETIKHGIIDAPRLFAELEQGPTGSLDAFSMSAPQLARAVQVKVSVVEEDPTEQGRRAVLNLGHTVGHGLERLSGFQLRHGHAVAIGLVAATRIAAASGLAEPELVDRVEAALRAWGLPADCPPLTVGSIWNAMGHDKKRRGRTLRWVLPRAVGEVTIDHEVASETVYRVLVEMGARDESEREGSE